MEILNEFINYIAKTNLFNFVIFLAIIIFVCVKINVKKKLSDAKENVNTTIQTSETAKKDSEIKLSEIEESFSHIQDEIDSILNKSSENADLVGEKILNDANTATATIEENSKRVIENHENILKNDLIKRTSLASVEIAKSHIIQELNNNAELHDKLIEESLGAIEGVEI